MKTLIFLHLPKNGGKTLTHLLDRIYKGENVLQIWWKGTVGNLEEFHAQPEDKRANIKLLKGHFSYGEHQYIPNECEYFTFIRRPEARLLSYYSYLKRNPKNRLYKQVVEEGMSFKDFIKLDEKDGNNGQIRKLSGINSSGEEMLELARKNIDKHFPVVGIQEYYDESLVVLAYKYGWKTPYYLRQNVSKKKKTITDEEFKIIKRLNEEDNLLYQAMVTRLKKQMKEIPFFYLKLLKLKIINRLIRSNIIRTAFGKPVI